MEKLKKMNNLVEKEDKMITLNSIAIPSNDSDFEI